MRKASSNWVGKTIMSVMFGILIVSFGIWGIADMFKGYGQSSLAKIGNTEITSEQFRNIFTEKLQQIGRQVGRPISVEQARAFGLDRQVLQQVISEAALDEGAKRMGLGQSDAAIVRAISDDPNFKGLDGNFDAQRFNAIIRQYGYNEQRYINEQRKVSLRRQISGAILAGFEPNKTQIEILARFANEVRTIDMITLTAAQAGKIDPPSPETIAAYFDERKQLFRAPEYRKIAILSLTPEEFAKTITVSDDDARKLFEAQRAKYSTPEKRAISQIAFPTEDEAKAARAKIDAGALFDNIAAERNLTPSETDLGLLTKSAIADPAIADAAFALPLNTVSQPVKGTLATVLLRVTRIDAGVEPVYETLAPTIKTELAQARAREQLRELHNKIEDERAGGANIAEAAAKLGLKAVTIEAVDRSGRAPNGEIAAGIPQGVDVITPAFASNIGVENDAIQANGGEVWFDVLAITPSRDRALDEVKAEVEKRWMEEQVSQQLTAKAAEIVEKLNKGATLAAEAASAGVKVVTPPAFKRQADSKTLPEELVAAAFRTPKDGVGQVQGTGPDQIVFKVKDVTVPPIDLNSEEAKRAKAELARVMSDEQLTQYISKLETDLGITINQAALATALGAQTQ